MRRDRDVGDAEGYRVIAAVLLLHDPEVVLGADWPEPFGDGRGDTGMKPIVA
tara:strand:+ start:28779 stop:28934 length:156 start_codon:yes stop_codon:yes gene_type:complete